MTAAGDPLEFSAINGVFNNPSTNRNKPLITGSIKSNVGHLESSSALAAIIKTILCFEKGKIPAQMHFVDPNPNIDFRRVRIPVALTDWSGPEQAVRRPAINTLGAGGKKELQQIERELIFSIGTNSHLVLEANSRPTRSVTRPERPFLSKVSAANDRSLEQLLLRSAKPSLPDLANTLLSRRSTLTRSVFFVAQTHEEAVAKLKSGSFKAQTTRKAGSQEVAFVYTGQGAQW